jgi:hypothetical protein
MLQQQAQADNARGSNNSRKMYGTSWANANDEQKALRMRTGFRGRGDYNALNWWQRLGHHSLRGLGSGIGSYFGNASMGHDAGASVSKWLGWGKYRRRNYRGRGDYGGNAGGNQIMGGSVDTPITVNASDDLSGDIYISHREFLQNVTATGGAGNTSPFANLTFALNPGLEQTFPWLSQIAQNFTLYELEGCIFEFRPTSGELGAVGSNALGKVVMATQYDPDAIPFTSTIQMENYDYANACKPSEHMLHGVETEPTQRATKMMYVRTGPSQKDKVFTDYGLFQIATEGLPITNGNTSTIGELWVTYRVKLSRAQLFGSLLGASIPTDYHFGYTAAGGGTLFVNTATQLTTNGQISSYDTTVLNSGQLARKKTNNLGTYVQYATGAPTTSFQVIFPPNIVQGTYQITVLDTHIDTTGLAASWTGFITPSGYYNCSLIGTWNSPATSAAGVYPWAAPSSSATAVGTGCSTSILINVTAPGNNIAIVTLLFNSAPANLHYTSVLVTQVNSAIQNL